MTIFKVYTQRLMAYLTWKRHPLVGLEQNYRDERFKVFLFEETEGLKQDVTYYSEHKDELDICIK